MLYDDKCKGAEAYEDLTKEFLRKTRSEYRMSKKFGLGKGLGALIPEDDIEEEYQIKSNANLISIN